MIIPRLSLEEYNKLPKSIEQKFSGIIYETFQGLDIDIYYKIDGERVTKQQLLAHFFKDKLEEIIND